MITLHDLLQRLDKLHKVFLLLLVPMVVVGWEDDIAGLPLSLCLLLLIVHFLSELLTVHFEKVDYLPTAFFFDRVFGL